MKRRGWTAAWVVAVTLLGCGGGGAARRSDAPARETAELPWATAGRGGADVVRWTDSERVALVGGTVWTAAGAVLEDGVVLIQGGRIQAVGRRADVSLPEGTRVVDVTGKHVTPGLIDTHSHMGVYAVPNLNATDDGNEATAPVTAEVWAGDSFWPQDPALARALAGGVTTLQVLPGSANLIGGRGVIVKTRPGLSVAEMRFPGAPDTLKMACGENPKRVYGEKNTAPSTRMGNVAGYRKAFQAAVEYRRSWREWKRKWDAWSAKRPAKSKVVAKLGRAESGPRKPGGDAKGEGDADDGDAEEPSPPARDFAMDTLSGVLDGRVLVQMHCYRADEMLRMLEVADEFGFRIRAFHHAVEAYKIRDVLAQRGVGVNTWPDWWGFKLEAFDAIPENLALLTEGGVHAVLHSDSETLVQHFGQEAGKAQAFGARAGVPVSDDAALRWITAEPAWVLGIDREVGTLERGKVADVVVWSARPLSVYAHAEQVFMDGALVFDRKKGPRGRPTDFELGTSELGAPASAGDGSSAASPGGRP